MWLYRRVTFSKTWSRAYKLFASSILVVAVGACGSEAGTTTVVDAAGEGTDTATHADSAAPGVDVSPSTPHGEIERVVEQMEDALNSAESERYWSYWCPDFRTYYESLGQVLDDATMLRQIEMYGTSEFTLLTVNVNTDGTSYSTEVSQVFSKAPDSPRLQPWTFSAESGRWLACSG